MVILKENGDADFTFIADLQLSAQGTWSMGKSLKEGIDLKITGGVVTGNATGIGKLFLRKDCKSIDKPNIEAKDLCTAITAAMTGGSFISSSRKLEIPEINSRR